MSRLRSPLAEAQGLGSAKEGASHWWVQRLTSVALVPLVLWFAFSVACLPEMNHAGFSEWLGSPVTATLLILFVVMMFYHLQLGLQVIIEDYVHSPWLKISSLVLMSFGCWVLATAAVISTLKVFLGN